MQNGHSRHDSGQRHGSLVELVLVMKVEYISLLSNLAQIFGAVAVFIQVYMIYAENKRAHLRNKRKDTVVAMTDFLRAIKNERRWLLSESNKNKLFAPTTLSEKDMEIAEQFLGTAERLSVGIRCDVYDISIVSNISRRFLISSYNDFMPYITHKRIKFSNSAIFEHYEWLICELGKKHKRKYFLPDPPAAPGFGD